MTPWHPDMTFPVPPVSTGYWTRNDWDRWILNHGSAPRTVSIEEAQAALDACTVKPSLAVAAIRSARLYASEGNHIEANKLAIFALDEVSTCS